MVARAERKCLCSSRFHSHTIAGILQYNNRSELLLVRQRNYLRVLLVTVNCCIRLEWQNNCILPGIIGLLQQQRITSCFSPLFVFYDPRRMFRYSQIITSWKYMSICRMCNNPQHVFHWPTKRPRQLSDRLLGVSNVYLYNNSNLAVFTSLSCCGPRVNLRYSLLSMWSVVFAPWSTHPPHFFEPVIYTCWSCCELYAVRRATPWKQMPRKPLLPNIFISSILLYVLVRKSSQVHILGKPYFTLIVAYIFWQCCVDSIDVFFLIINTQIKYIFNSYDINSTTTGIVLITL